MSHDEFRQLLMRRADHEIVQQHIIDGPCAVMHTDEHFALKARISEKYQVNPRAVVVVGSAKLGFSISPNKRYRSFHDGSDIDIALVNGPLFDQFWEDAFLFSCGGTFWRTRAQFFGKLADGWIRPDYMPRSDAYPRRAEWWDYFNSERAQTNLGSVRVRAGLFKDWVFLEKYHERAVAQCREAL